MSHIFRNFKSILFCLIFMGYGSSFAQINPPQRVNFQGRLTDLSDNPLNGSFNLSFSLYNVPTGGAALWTETQTGVSVVNGAVESILGSVTPIPYSVSASSSVYLEIQVGAEVLSPRQPFSSVLYAMNTYQLAGKTYDTFVDTSTVQTIGGIKTFSANPVFNAGAIGQASVSGLPAALATVAAATTTLKAQLDGISGDNLGNHTATTSLNMANFSITNVNTIIATNSITAGSFIGNGFGLTGVTAANVPASGVQAGPLSALVIASSIAVNSVMNQSIVSLSASKLFGNLPAINGSALTGISGDNFGNHTATTSLNMAGFQINNVSTIAAGSFIGNGFGLTGVAAANVPASGVQPGSLSASVITSSIAVNSVVDQSIVSVSAFKLTGALPAINGSALTGISGDNLGNHTATTSLNMANFPINNVSSLTVINSVSAANFIGNGSWLTGIAGDNLGSHIATTVLNMSDFGIVNASTSTFRGSINVTSAAGYAMDGWTILRSSDSLYSVFVGREAGRENTGAYNSFLGWQAGISNTTGEHNSFLGLQAGMSNTTGRYNSFLGSQAGMSNTTGEQNSFLGHEAGMSNTTGGQNSFLGYLAGSSNTDGWGNSFLGSFAGWDNTTGQQNSFLGSGAGSSNTGGGFNSFLGASAGASNTTGGYNSFLGANAGAFNTTGGYNSFLGFLAGSSNQTGSANSIFGVEAGYGISGQSFSNSTIMGYRAGYGLTTGSDNTLLGWQAGFNVTTGTGNIIIGYNQRTPAATANNFLNIGGVLYGDLSAKTIGISTRVPQAALDIVSTGTAVGQMAQIWRSGDGVIRGSMSATGVMMATRFVGDGSGLTGISGSGDNLGNHIATTMLNMGGFGIAGVSSITVSSITTTAAGVTFSTNVFVMNGNVGIGTTGPVSKFDVLDGSITVRGTGAGLVLTDASRVISPETLPALGAGVRVSTNVYIVGFSSAARYFGDGSGLTNLAGDNLGSHIATMTLNMSNFGIINASTSIFRGFVNVTSTAGYAMDGWTILRANDSLNGVFVGREAGRVNTGAYNSFLGSYAGYSNTTGVYNSFLGYSAGASNTTGWDNSFLGLAAGYFNKIGSANSIFGTYAGYGFNGQSFSSSTIMGYKAGYVLSTGSDNLLLGFQAGDNLNTGSRNIIIGYDIDAQSAAGSNQLSIGNLIFATGGFGTGTTVGTGNVGIGTTGPAHRLHVAGNAIVTSSMSVSGSGLSGTTPVFQVIGGTMTILANGNVGIGTDNPSSNLHVNGPITTATRNITAAYTITGADSVIFADTTGGSITITLPPASVSTIGRVYDVYKSTGNANAVIIVPDGTNTINAKTSISTGVNTWFMLRIIGYTATAWLSIFSSGSGL